MAEFENLNTYRNIDFLQADSADDLKAQLLKITSPMRILHIYSAGSKHFAWILSDVKINKIKKGNKNGFSSKI